MNARVAGDMSSAPLRVMKAKFFTVTDAGSFALRLAEISPAGQRLASAFQSSPTAVVSTSPWRPSSVPGWPCATSSR